LGVVLGQMVVVAMVEEKMTAKDRKFGGRTITLDKGTAERLEAYRQALEEELGCPVSYRLAIAIAINRAKPNK
jgi:hypothetical protein